ncbi:hypothetical protein KCU73_g9271, partial [Aureobasidium melanogenum]
MDDSASDTSHDEVKSAFYKISPEEMCKMKHSLKNMEGRLSFVRNITGRAHIDPILNELKIVKTSLTEAEPASENIITPEASNSGSETEPEVPAPAICATLVEGGIKLVMIHMLEQLEAQKNETSDRIVDFIDSYFADAVENGHEDDFLTAIRPATEADPDFVKEFEIRTRKIMSEFFTRKIKDALAKDLTEAFSKI